MQLTGTNRSFGLIPLITPCPTSTPHRGRRRHRTRFRTDPHTGPPPPPRGHGRPGDASVFAGLVAQAKQPDPIPSRTRPSNASAPMVLCLKARESRSPPGPPRSTPHPHSLDHDRTHHDPCGRNRPHQDRGPPIGNPEGDAGWSSPVARQAHNLKAAGSNPAPATNTHRHDSADNAADEPRAQTSGLRRVDTTTWDVERGGEARHGPQSVRSLLAAISAASRTAFRVAPTSATPLPEIS